MSEFDEMLSSILSDPGQMKKIMSVAGSLMDSEKKESTQQEGATQEEESSSKDNEPLSADLLSGLGNLPLGNIMSAAKKVFGAGSKGVSSEKTALLTAMKPWMSEKRRNKLDRAVKIAAAMRIGLALFKKTEADINE